MAILETRDIITVTAGEAITAGQYCFILHPDAPYTYIDGATAGRAYLADKSKRHCSINANLAGFALDTVSAGQSIRIKREGNLGGFAGLIPGQCYQPANTAGTIEIFENHRAALPSPIAQAISATELIILKQSWSVRGKGYAFGNFTTKICLFATDAISTGVARTVALGYAGASSSSLKSYCFGGGGASADDTIDAQTMSTELFSDIGNLVLALRITGSFGSSIKGYGFGGYNSVPANADSINSIIFATEGNAADVANLSAAMRAPTGGNSATSGFIVGGWTSSASNAIQNFTFATEVDATNVATLATATAYTSAINSKDKLYPCGGTSGSYQARIESMPFATNVCAGIAAVLSVARAESAPSSSAVCGHILGGLNGQTNHDQFMFSTEVASTSSVVPASIAACGGASS